jgi:hypothetical protein
MGAPFHQPIFAAWFDQGYQVSLPHNMLSRYLAIGGLGDVVLGFWLFLFLVWVFMIWKLWTGYPSIAMTRLYMTYFMLVLMVPIFAVVALVKVLVDG